MTAGDASAQVLDRRTLNRTLLARQLLLERVERPADDVIDLLVGLQAQEPPDPYVALWSRMVGFDPQMLSALIEDRRAVRMGLLRGTLHLATADDALGQYPILADVMRRSWRSSPFIKQLDGVDVDAVTTAARALLEERPRTPAELGAELGPSWPDRDPASLAYAARFLLPLVQVPPRGLWGRTGRATNTTLESWLGRPLVAQPRVEDLVMRYLAVFGPATVADMRVWSWLTGLREVVEGLRPRLRTYRDEAGRELFDVAYGAIADPDLPAPIRFLPQYDNVFLSHEDRSRISGELTWGVEFGWKGVVLIDGGISAAWRVRRDGKRAVMTIELGRRLSAAERLELEEEATALASFLDPDRSRELTIVEPG
jgi:hypothetical protein